MKKFRLKLDGVFEGNIEMEEINGETNLILSGVISADSKSKIESAEDDKQSVANEKAKESSKVSVEIENFTQEFYDQVRNPDVREINIPEGTFRIDTIQSVNIERSLKIKSPSNRSNILIGKEFYDPSTKSESEFLFFLKRGDLLIENVNFCQPQQIRSTQPWMPNLFRSEENDKAKWTAVVKNCDTTFFGRNGGMGLGRFYGSIEENHIAAINMKHVGVGYMEAKNPWKDCVLYVTLDNVKTDAIDQTEWGSGNFLTKGVISDNLLTLTGSTSFKSLYNVFFLEDKGSNRAFIAHIGRFTFLIDRVDALRSEKACVLRLAPKAGDRVKVKDGLVFFIGKEPQASDSFQIFGVNHTITMKNRTDATKWVTWAGSKDHELAFQLGCKTDIPISDGEYYLDSYNSTFDLNGKEQDLYLVYKGNQDFRSYPNTEFGNGEIIFGDVVSHLCYNHDVISLWAKDTDMLGYYRQTQHEGKTLGYNMVNCKGFQDEFNPPVPVTSNSNLPMPERVLNVLNG